MSISFIGMAIVSAVSIAATFLFRPRAPDTSTKSEGPRLNELGTTGSQYGIGIPKVWGMYVVPGNIIWLGDVIEYKDSTTTTTRTSGGLSGGSSKSSHTSTTYEYTASLAVGLARGRIKRVIKIFMDNQLVFDASGNSVDITVDGLAWRLYHGTENQLPDSIIAAKEGEDRTPAFRGLSYVVFDELLLTDFANRIPQMRFIIEAEGEGRCIAKPFEIADLAPRFFVDFRLGVRYDTIGSTLYAQSLQTQKVVAKTTLDGGWVHAGAFNHPVATHKQSVFISRYRDNRNVIEMRDGTSLAFQKSISSSFQLWGPAQKATVQDYVSLVNGEQRTIICIEYGVLNIGINYRVGATINDMESGIAVYIGRSGERGPTLPGMGTAGNYEIDPVGFVSYFAQGPHMNGAAAFVWLHSIGMRDLSGKLTMFSGHLTLRNIWVQDEVEVKVDALTGKTSIDIYPALHYGDFIRNITPLDIDPEGRIPWMFTLGAGAGIIGAQSCVVDDIFRDPGDGGIIITACDQTFVVKYSATGHEIWRFMTNENWTWKNHQGIAGETNRGVRISAGNFVVRGYKDGQLGLYALDTRTGEEVYWCPRFNQGGLAFDTATNIVVENRNAIWLDQSLEQNEISVAEIIEDLSLQVDQPHNDFSDIAHYTVIGYLQAGPDIARAMIEPLSELYNFDAIETNGILKWIRRGQPSSRSYTPPEMVTLDNETGAVIESTRTEEFSLPQAVSVTYADVKTDFEATTFYRQRFAGNEGYDTTRSRNRMTIEVPASVRPEIAKRSADVLLMGAWFGRTSHKMRLPRPAMLLDAGDVITISMAGDFPEDVMIGRSSIGANMVVELEGIGQDSSQYIAVVPESTKPGYIPQSDPWHIPEVAPHYDPETPPGWVPPVISDEYQSGVDAETGHGHVPPVITPEMLTRLYLLPVPYLQDANDTTNTSLLVYYAMGAYRQGWRRGTIERLTGAGRYEFAGSMQYDSPHGLLIEPLQRADPHAVFATDEKIIIRVAMIYGELEGVSYEQILHGANAAVVLRSSSVAELIQFRDVVLEEDGTYTLTGIVRGQRGTDYTAVVADSPAGTPFIVVSPETTDAVMRPIESLGHIESYRAYGANQRAQNGDSRAIKVAGYELMPWAPVHLKFTRMGEDFKLDWTRRTRLRGGLRENTGEVPLNEDYERYEVDIWDGLVLLRTVVVNDATTLTYTEAQRIEDGSPGTVEFVVYQMSATVGRGYPSQRIASGPMWDISQLNAWALELLPAPDYDVSQASVFALQPAEPYFDIAQLTAFSVSGIKAPWQITQFNAFAATDISASEWRIAQQSAFVIHRST